MAISRRAVLTGAAALPLLGRGAAADHPRFVGAVADDQGYAIRAITLAGEKLWETRAPGRGHGFAIGHDRLVAFARRPGPFALLLDAASGRVLAEIDPPAGSTFNGHGVFAAAGDRLFATVTRNSDDSGWVSVHAGEAGWQSVAAWPSLGQDPHEILRRGELLIVANGGWAEGRMPEAGEPVTSSLVVLDARDGRAIVQLPPPSDLAALSLRHMALYGDGVAVAAQTRDMGLPTVLILAGGELRSLPALPLAGYCGSIAANDRAICVASPVAGLALVLGPDGTIRDQTALTDVCGAVAAGGGFLLSSGHGVLAGLGVLAGPSAQRRVSTLRWDNHLAALT